MKPARDELSRRLDRPMITPLLLQLARKGDHAAMQRVLDEADERERRLREAPRDAQGS